MQFRQRPFKILNRESAGLPVRHCLFGSKTIEVDRDINVFSGEASDELFKKRPPIVAKDCSLALPIFHRPVVRPPADFKNAGAFGASVAKDLVRPPAFEIAATPHAYAVHVWEFECAIHPATASPFWRTHIPIRMIVERNDDDRPRNSLQSKRC